MIPVTIQKPNDKESIIKTLALLDTGAEKTAITKELADALSLTKNGEWTFGSANGAFNADTTCVDICMPEKVAFNNFEVGVIPMPGMGMVLGMNIISQGNLSLINTADGLILRFEL
ncbi:MAG: retroviral-like aspartic protease family protein [Bacteroides sp.]|nr:retroviral-like aspartic protease family protein [Bacteroides sp.]